MVGGALLAGDVVSTARGVGLAEVDVSAAELLGVALGVEALGLAVVALGVGVGVGVVGLGVALAEEATGAGM